MNYYTATIPFTLAEKLKEKGMPMMKCFNITSHNSFSDDGGVHFYYLPTYAEVFDWLMRRNILIILNPCYNATEDEIVGWIASVNLANTLLVDDFTFGFNYGEHLSWYDVVNAAIEKAITLI